MTLPFDRALECGWGYGTHVYVTEKDFLPFGDPDTLVGTRAEYRGSKFARFKRVPAYLSSFTTILRGMFMPIASRDHDGMSARCPITAQWGD